MSRWASLPQGHVDGGEVMRLAPSPHVRLPTKVGVSLPFQASRPGHHGVELLQTSPSSCPPLCPSTHSSITPARRTGLGTKMLNVIGE